MTKRYVDSVSPDDEEVDIEQQIEEQIENDPPQTFSRNQTKLSAYIKYAVVGGITVLILAAIGAMIIFMMTTRGGSEGPVKPGSPDSKLFAGRYGAVAADVPVCSQIGVEILRDKRGNAVDAAIATTFCIGVVGSPGSGIGGGAIMLVSLGDEVVSIDSREMAPSAAHKDMYTNHPTITSERGGLAIAVPGEVKGLYTAWKKYGSVAWKDLISPSIKLARDGYRVSAYLYSKLSASPYKEWILQGTFGSEMRRVYAPTGVIAKEGDIIKNVKLAASLEQISEKGDAAFYDTSNMLAQDILSDLQAAGSIISEADLTGYYAEVTPPLSTYYHGYKVYGPQPEISGGACLIFILNLLERYQADELAFDSFTYQHLLIEAMKFAFGHRMELGDPDYVSVNATRVLEAMLDKDYAAMIRRKYLHTNETIADFHNYLPHLADGVVPLKASVPNGGTSHISVVDSNRMAVSLTSTVNLIFGSFVMGEKTGIVFNDQMDDFSIPGRPNAYNLAPSEANFIAPGKRPLSSMTPTIVHQDGEFKMAVGASGGPYIITATTNVLLNVLSHGMSMNEAISKPRFHHQLLPAEVKYEETRSPAPGLMESLQKAGHKFSKVPSLAVTQGIVLEKGVLNAASDPRKGGLAAAY